MNKKLIAIGATALFFTLLFTPQVLAIEKEESNKPVTYFYGIANITGVIELKDSKYPGSSLLNSIFNKTNIGLRMRVEAKLIEGTIQPKFSLKNENLAFRNVTIPSDSISHADLIIGLYKGTLEKIDNTTDQYTVEGTIVFVWATLVPAE